MIKKLLLISVFLFLTSQLYAAELLVRAKRHWMDEFSSQEVSALDKGRKRNYEARTQAGDIVSVSDHYNGNGYKLPDCFIISVKDMKEADAKQYENSLNGQEDVAYKGIAVPFTAEKRAQVEGGWISGEGLFLSTALDIKDTDTATQIKEKIKAAHNGMHEFIGDITVSAAKEVSIGGTRDAQAVYATGYDVEGTVRERFIKRVKKFRISKDIVDKAIKDKTDRIEMSLDDFKKSLEEKTGVEGEVKAANNNPLYCLYRSAKPKIEDIVNRIRPYFDDKAYCAQFLYKTVKPSGGDYNKLEDSLNLNEQNLTGKGWYDDEIDGTWSSADTTAVTIHNYTTTSSDYINIYTTSAARHKGKWSTSYYILSSTSYHTIVLNNDVNYVKITGLQIDNTGQSDTFNAIANGDNSGNYGHYFEVQKCLVKYKQNGAYGNIGSGIYSKYAYGLKFINNIVFSVNGGASGTGYPIGIQIVAPYSDVASSYVYNNTVYMSGGDGDKGFVLAYRTGNALLAKNNISQGCTTDFTFGTNVTHTYNLSKDATGEIQATLTFVDAANYDCHLAATDTSAIDAGTDLSGTFTDDIDGDTIPSGHWPIGADYRAGAAGGAYSGWVNVIED